MDAIKPLLLRWLVTAALVVLAGALVLALTLTGLLRLLDALQLWLSDLWGAVPATLTLALICLMPVLLSIWALRRMQLRLQRNVDDSADGEVRSLVRAHPWEAVTAAFVCGFSYRSDPQVSALLIKESLQQLRAKAPDPANTP